MIEEGDKQGATGATDKSQTFRCRICNYTTQYKHNLTRHMKVHSGGTPPIHPRDIAEDGGSDGGRNSPSDDLAEIDIEDYINEKVNSILKDKVGIDKPISKSTTTDGMKSLFSSTGGTLVAGMALGYIITSNIPMIVMMLSGLTGKKKNFPMNHPPFPPPPPQQTKVVPVDSPAKLPEPSVKSSATPTPLVSSSLSDTSSPST